MKTLELWVPDRVVSVEDETFYLDNQKVHPETIELSGFGAMVKLGGECFHADQDEMWGYPNPGVYYLNKN